MTWKKKETNKPISGSKGIHTYILSDPSQSPSIRTADSSHIYKIHPRKREIKEGGKS